MEPCEIPEVIAEDSGQEACNLTNYRIFIK